MNKRLLNQLAKTGYFKNANGALYAAVKRALRKPPSPNEVRVIDKPDHDSLTAFGAPSKAVNISEKTSSPNIKRKDRENISMT